MFTNIWFIFQIFATIFSITAAFPQGYTINTPSIPFRQGSGSRGGFRGGSRTSGLYGTPNRPFTPQSPQSFSPCGDGLLRDALGNCVEPDVNRHVMVYDSPPQDIIRPQTPDVPTPKLNYNIVFVRTPDKVRDEKPIVIPPPQQKTLVYVLNKKQQIEGPELIEVPSNPQKPEVYYVNYNEGENPSLPGGIDLQSALASSSSTQGEVVGGGSKRGNFGGSLGGSGRPSNLYGTPS